MKQVTDKEQWGPIDAKILYMSFWFIPMARSGSTSWGATWPNIHGFFENDRVTYVWHKNEMEKFGGATIERIILDNDAREKVWDGYQDVLNKINKLSDNITADPNKDLYANAKEFFELFTLFWDHGITPEVGNFAAPDYLAKKLSKYSKSEIDEISQALLASDRLSFHQQSELELLQAAQTNSLKEYADKWYWVENGYYESKILTAEYFQDKVKDLSDEELTEKIKKIEEYPKEIQDSKDKVIEKYKVDQEIVDMADKMAFSIWWQDHRKGESLRLHSTIDILCQTIAAKHNLKYENLLYYKATQWRDLFSDQPKILSQDVLAERKELSYFEMSSDEGVVKEHHGKDAQDNYEMWGLSHVVEDTDVSDIKGTPVSRGKVKGKIRVLLSHRQADQMEEGEILVAPMTSPDYILAMRKASAIITDVGGLMSHAAIVSRELGVPCIVGTKVATQVLKDGEMVEVDADNGIIKRK